MVKRTEIAKRQKLIDEERQARTYYDTEERKQKHLKIRENLDQKKQEKSKMFAMLDKKNLLRNQGLSKGQIEQMEANLSR